MIELFVISGIFGSALLILGAWKLYHAVLNSGLLTRLTIIDRSIGPFALLYVDVKVPHSRLHQERERVSRMAVEDARLVQVASRDLAMLVDANLY